MWAFLLGGPALKWPPWFQCVLVYEQPGRSRRFDDAHLSGSVPLSRPQTMRSPERRAITVAQLLDEAREGLARLSPQEAHEAALDGAALVDIRSDKQRLEDGKIACATSIPRNVLEWRLDPACPHRDPRLARRDHVVIVLCDEGYQSSLAAATLRRFGLDAADVVCGFQAWRAAGLPVER